MTDMVPFLLISILLLAVISYAVYLWQRPSGPRDDRKVFPEPPGRGLFSESAELLFLPEENASEKRAAQREDLLNSARSGNLAALVIAAGSDDGDLYYEILDELAGRAATDKDIFNLVAHITSSPNLRMSARLAKLFINAWENTSNSITVAEALHVAALSDDATVYQTAAELAVERWRRGGLPTVSGSGLAALIESEYWLLSSGARTSGAGFLLKRAIADSRRALAETANV